MFRRRSRPTYSLRAATAAAAVANCALKRGSMGKVIEEHGRPMPAVEVVTQSYAITGRCHGLTEQVRLIDILNNPEETFLQFSNVKVRDLPGSTEVIAAEGPFLLDKRSIIFARSLESPERETKRRETNRVDYVEKAKSKLLVFAPPFRISGTAHLIKDADLSVALPRLFGSFLAMTKVTIAHEKDASLAWKDDFVVVNGPRIEMVCASPPENGRGRANAGRDQGDRGRSELQEMRIDQ